jgi:pyruvate dehydrogenase E2 component (dihydrolipoamide acetyltransferase)
MGRSSGRRGEAAPQNAQGARSLEFRLPDLGEGLTEAEIVHWLVDVGDTVAVDQPVVEVETAKAMVEVPCPYGGVVTARFGEEGTELPVGAPLLTVAVAQAAQEDGGREPSAEQGTGAARTGRAGRAGRAAEKGPGVRAGSAPADGQGAERPGPRAAAAHEGSGRVLVGYGTAGAQARRRRVRPPSGGGWWSPREVSGGAGEGPWGDDILQEPDARDARDARDTQDARDAARVGSDAGLPSGTGTGSPVPGAARDDHDGTVAQAAASRMAGPVPVISPLVRKLARDHGLDLRELSGSGPHGLILRADVEQAVRATASTQAPPADTAPGTTAADAVAAGRAAAPGDGPRSGSAGGADGAGAGSGVRVPLRGMRGAVADKMARSRREIPDATCWVDADATALLDARAALNAAGGPKISLLALLARICTAALARYPELNSRVDAEAREVVQLDRVHLGFAAQTERGLMVPVVRDAQTRNAASLSAEFARLTDAARAATLTPGELTGGTFTLNNYGVFGVDGSTPIVNHPEAAMLGVGRICPKPWVYQGELAVRQVVQLSLTFDHRVCDGGTAGGFLRYVADCVEQPVVLLKDL